MPTYQYTTSGSTASFGRPWTPAIRTLILANAFMFLLQFALPGPLLSLLSLQTPELFSQGRFWQPVTYLFLHAGFWHLFLNMFALWMFGCEVEEKLGTRRFYFYYFATGVGAGLCVASVGLGVGEQSVTVGSSGAVFGILMAYGLLFAERELMLLLFFILPVRMKAKTMVVLFAAFEFFAGVGNAFGRISHLAHLSGLAIGFLYFLWQYPDLIPRFTPFSSLKIWWLGRRVKPYSPDEDEVDRILDKISQQGINSLSRHEREILSRAAKGRQNSRYRNN